MAVIKCKMCGGDLNISEGLSVCECEYCGTKQTVPSADSEKKLTLFARANRLRLANEFDKAAGVYESIVADFPEEAEAYWGLVLCRYGIEYVDDPATGKKIPTCHRVSFDSVMEDTDFEQACENADAIARRQYREEAKAFEDIRRGIIEVSGKEEPYDIFICYKETAENGDRTVDSVIAQDVYDALTDKGYRVFFSRISLEDKLGTEYEPYIFAALNSAKLMLAFGTDFEYYNAVWVKNEWSRFLKLMEKDKSRHLIPCYKNLDPYDMPKEFQRLQGQDMGKVGAVQDLLRGIEKILPRKDENHVVISMNSNTPSSNPTVDNLLKRTKTFLGDRDWNAAKEYADRILDLNPECADAYLLRLMAQMHAKSKAEAKDIFASGDYSQIKDYSHAKEFSDDAMFEELASWEDLHQQNIRNLFEKAQALVNENKWDEAEQTYNKVFKLDKNNGDAQLKIDELSALNVRFQQIARELEYISTEKALRRLLRSLENCDSSIVYNELRLKCEQKLLEVGEENEKQTKENIVWLLELDDSALSAITIRIQLREKKKTAINVQSNCEKLIREKRLDRIEEKGHTVYCIPGYREREAERREREIERISMLERLEKKKNGLEKELETLGLLAVSRKKELKAQLAAIESQIELNKKR